MKKHVHLLPTASLGSRRELTSFHFGTRGTGPKAYLQGSLHADEVPGMLVLHHLKALLEQAERDGLVTGEVVIVPVANPIGLAQSVLFHDHGRFELGSGQNFNRNYPDLFALVDDSIADALGDDPAANRLTIRQAIRTRLFALEATTELDALRHTLMRLAYDADTVLDLHCDYESVMHLYTEDALWPQAEPLARYLGAQTSLLASGSGGNSFDECCSGVWWRLPVALHAAHDRAFNIPLACLSATVELRGQSDVDHATARADALHLYQFLQHRGVIHGDPPAAPALLVPPTPLAGSIALVAPSPGVIVFAKTPGAWIAHGEHVADIVDPISGVVTPVMSDTAGVMYARTRRRYALRGSPLCSVAGAIAVRSGALLSP